MTTEDRPLVVLGATGSIGRQALDVAERLGIEVVGLASRSGEGLMELAARHPHARIAVESPRPSLRAELAGDPRVGFGPDAVESLARTPGAVVLNAVVGAAGLRASVAALETGNRLALANKESLVAGGPVVLAAAEAGGGEILPVDSEHSAIFQCLVGEDRSAIARIVLTASGGPFRGRSREELEGVTVEEALAHPTWRMGPRITIDSATLMNKGLEVIEAHWLFDVDYDRIRVVVHPQSIVHSLVDLVDGSSKAHLGFPDMRVPIQYALTYPRRRPGPVDILDLAGRTLTFEEPDLDAFPALRLAYEAGRRGGSAPAVLNAADEIAVQAFLERRIGFTTIPVVLERTLESVAWRPIEKVEDVLEVDAEARTVARSVVGSC